MRCLSVAVLLGLLCLSSADAYKRYSFGTGSNSKSYSVKSFVRKDGTFVNSHRNTVPNKTDLDNYSTRGNYNPYTGKTGTRSPRW